MSHRTVGTWGVLLLGTGATAIYSWIAWTGDWAARPGALLALHAVLLALLAGAFMIVRQGDASTFRLAIGLALLFRLAAVPGAPALSDDVYRYVWDGRVQVAGLHPYHHAPDDPALDAVSGAGVREHINHSEVRTIYPPGAQALFASMAALGLGPVGFKLVFGLVDFGIVLVLVAWSRRGAFPAARVVWYAWNPVAILETAGSGHVEPVGVIFLVGSIAAIGANRRVRAGAALATAAMIKVFPGLLLPGLVRRGGVRAGLAAAAVVVILCMPYVVRGPAVAPGTYDYAERWQRNALVYPAVEAAAARIDTASRLKPVVASLQSRLGEDALPWDRLYRHVWPRDVARAIVAVAAIAWVLAWTWGRARDWPQACLWALGGVLLLSPTVHPWYVLWILPLAVVVASPGWLALAATVPLAYFGGVSGDVPWAIRAVEYGIPMALLLGGAIRAARSRLLA